MTKTTTHNTEVPELTVDELTADELDQIAGGSTSMTNVGHEAKKSIIQNFRA